MTEPANGCTKWLCLTISVIGGLALIGMTAIAVVETHPEHAVIYAGLLTTLVATLIGAVLTVAGLKKLGNSTEKLVIQTNSRMTELLQAAEKLAYAAGKLAGETTRDDPGKE